MVMREDGDGKTWENNIMTKYVGNSFLGNTLCRSFRELVMSVVLVSWWSVNFVLVVVGVLVALWWCVRSVLTASGDFGSFCGVLAVFRCCLGGIEGMVFSCTFSKQTASPVNTKTGVKENVKLCYWGCRLG